MKTYKAGELREDMLVVPVHMLEAGREELARLRADSAELARVRGVTVISKILPELDKASSFASQLVGTACHLDPSKYYRIDFVILGEPAEIKQSIPEGFALVPVEPTRAMIEAPFAGKFEGQCMQTQMRAREIVAETYRAMLAAAPKGDGHE